MVEPPSEIQRIERLIPLVDAFACIDRMVGPVTPQRLALGHAVGLSLVEDIVNSYVHHPASAIALRDGIAVAAEATLDASAYAPALLPGAPALVEVGDSLPAGANAVAPCDVFELRDRTAHPTAHPTAHATAYALGPLAPGDGVLPQGGDAAPGDVLARAGTRLRRSHAALLSGLGVTEVAVRWPIVRINVAHGRHDSVVTRIVDVLSLAAEAAGARVLIGPYTRVGVDTAPAAASAVMLVGGSGSGRRDDSVRDLARYGSVAFHGVALAPGETAAFGLSEQRPILIVPGRLDAALAAWLTLGRRMLGRLAGRSDDEDAHTTVTLTRKIASSLGLAEIVPVARDQGGVVPLASGYLSLQSLARADGYVLVPADSEGFPAGAQVEMRPLP
jgi:molybdopterin biosynthesis enzyme